MHVEDPVHTLQAHQIVHKKQKFGPAPSTSDIASTRLLESINMSSKTMKKISDITHLCRSSTPTENGCDFAPATKTQIYEHEYNDFTTSNRPPSTPYSCSTTQSFSRRTVSHTGVGGEDAGGENAPLKVLIWWKSRLNLLKSGQNVRKFWQNMCKPSQNCSMCFDFTKKAPKTKVKTYFFEVMF